MALLEFEIASRENNIIQQILKKRTMGHRLQFIRIVLVFPVIILATLATIEQWKYKKLERGQNITGTTVAEFISRAKLHCSYRLLEFTTGSKLQCSDRLVDSTTRFKLQWADRLVEHITGSKLQFSDRLEESTTRSKLQYSDRLVELTTISKLQCSDRLVELHYKI